MRYGNQQKHQHFRKLKVIIPIGKTLKALR